MSAERKGGYKVWGMMDPNSKLVQVLDTLRAATVKERLLEEGVLYPTPLPNFEVVIVKSFKGSVDKEVEEHDPEKGMLMVLTDFDDCFRPRQKVDWMRGRFGEVRQDVLAYAVEIKSRPGVDFGVWSDQPSDGFQVAGAADWVYRGVGGVLQRVHPSLGSDGFEYLPECFEERDIFYSGAETRWLLGLVPTYDVAHKGGFNALVQVGDYIHRKHGFENVHAIVGIDDRGPGIVALNRLHHHVYHNYGYEGDFRAHWILPQRDGRIRGMIKNIRRGGGNR